MSIVLITNISTLSLKVNGEKSKLIDETEYQCFLKKCKKEDNSRITIWASHTNESIFKGLNEYINNNDLEHINKVIALVSKKSDTTLKFYIKEEEQELSAFEYYKKIIETESKKTTKVTPIDISSDNQTSSPDSTNNAENQIEIIKILFEPKKDSTSDSSEAGRKEKILTAICENLSKNDTVYIDTAGGSRTIANIIQLLTKILQYKGIKNPLNVYSDIQNKPGRILDTREFTKMTNLAEAFNEFMTSGKSSQLKELYTTKENQTDEEKELFLELIEAMNNFSDKIRLGLVDDLDSTITSLKTKVDECMKFSATKMNSIIIKQLLPEIKTNLIGDNNDNKADYLKIIEWCVKNDLIQQALTLIVEKLPKYLIDKGVIQFNDEDIARHEFNVSKTERNSNHNFSTFEMYSFYEKILDSIKPGRFDLNGRMEAIQIIEKGSASLDNLGMSFSSKIEKNRNKNLSELYYGYIYSKAKRNRINHASNKDKIKGKNSNILTSKGYSDIDSISEIKNSLLHYIDVVRSTIDENYEPPKPKSVITKNKIIQVKIKDKNTVIYNQQEIKLSIKNEQFYNLQGETNILVEVIQQKKDGSISMVKFVRKND